MQTNLEHTKILVFNCILIKFSTSGHRTPKNINWTDSINKSSGLKRRRRGGGWGDRTEGQGEEGVRAQTLRATTHLREVHIIMITSSYTNWRWANLLKAVLGHKNDLWIQLIFFFHSSVSRLSPEKGLLVGLIDGSQGIWTLTKLHERTRQPLL